MTEHDLKEQIKADHREAELARLDSGMAGCGCSDCQEFYREIELSRYGDRVIRLDGLIIVTEAKRSRRLDNANADGDNAGDIGTASDTSDVAKIADGKSIGETILQHADGAQTATDKGLNRRGRPPKTGEVHRSTLWRRRRAEGR